MRLNYPKNIILPYTKAIFAVASQNNARKSCLEELLFLVTLTSCEEIKSITEDPRCSKEKLLAILQTLCLKNSVKLSPITLALLELLIKMKRLVILPSITNLYEKMLARAENRKNIIVTTARKLTDNQIAALTEALAKKLKAEIILEPKVKPKLLGGLILQSGDFILDISVLGRVKRLAQVLKSS